MFRVDLIYGTDVFHHLKLGVLWTCWRSPQFVGSQMFAVLFQTQNHIAILNISLPRSFVCAVTASHLPISGHLGAPATVWNCLPSRCCIKMTDALSYPLLANTLFDSPCASFGLSAVFLGARHITASNTAAGGQIWIL